MKKNEIIELLKQGHPIIQKENYIFKYNRLKGSKTTYSINDVKITSTQVNNLKDYDVIVKDTTKLNLSTTGIYYILSPDYESQLPTL